MGRGEIEEPLRTLMLIGDVGSRDDLVPATIVSFGRYGASFFNFMSVNQCDQWLKNRYRFVEGFVLLV
ncbi:MAG: hypothetical protein ACI92G_000469 [Candidatus Pelagisphaera sp.]|jgi:hypothetical protein